MDKTFDSSDENASKNVKNQGMKRPQLQSPFSAATPKSRAGKEPKRPFGESPLAALANRADMNLEETAIETPTPPTEVSSFSMADDSCVDSNLEQTAIMDNTVAVDQTSCSSKDLSMVEEGDETDLDVTLSGTFAEQVTVAETGSKTPTPSTPKPTVEMIPDSETPTAPPTLAAHIQDTLETVDHLSSPAYTPKPVVDQSMHEFLMLEQESHHVVTERELQEKITKLQSQIQEIHEARIFEERALMQNIDAIGKKAKADRATEREKIRELEEKLEKAVAKGGDDAEKKQLEDQLALLNARLEELTEKAMRVDEMKEGMLAYEERLQAVMNEKLEVKAALGQTREEIELLQKLNKEGSEKIAELEAKLVENSDETAKSSSSEARVAELEQDREELRKMMLDEMTALESQLDEVREQLRKEQEKNAAPQEDHVSKIQQLEEQSAIAETKINEMEHLTAQLSADLESLRQQHFVETDEMQKKHENAMRLLQEQFSLAEAKLFEYAQNAGNVENLNSQLTAALEQIQESEELKKSRDEEIRVLREQFSAAERALAVAMEDAGKVEDLTIQLVSAQQQIASLESQTNSEELQQKHQEEMQVLQEKHDSQLTAAQHLCAEVEASRVQISELTADLVTCQQQLDALRLEFESSSNERSLKMDELAEKASKVEQLEEGIIAYETRLDTVMNEKLEVEKSLSVAVEENNQLKKLAEDEAAKISELETKLVTFSEQNDISSSMESRITELEQEREEIRQLRIQEVASLEAQLGSAQVQLAVEQAKNSASQEDSAKITQLEEQLAVSVAKISEIQQSADQLSTELQSIIQQHMEEIREINAKHTEETQMLKTMLDQSEEKIAEFAQNAVNLEELNTQLAAGQREILEFQKTMEELQKTSKEEVEMIQEKYLAAQSALEAASQDSAKVEGLTAELESALQHIASLENETTTDSAKVDDLTAKLDAAQQKIADLENQTTSDAGRVEEISAQLSAAHQQIAAFENQTSTDAEKVNDLSAQLSAAQQQITQLNDLNTASAEKIDDLSAKLASAQQQITDLESWTASEDMQKKHEEEINVLQEKLDNQLTVVSSLQEQLAASEAKLVESAQSVFMVEELKSQVTAASEQISDMLQSAEDAQKRHEATVQELQEKIETALSSNAEVETIRLQMSQLTAELVTSQQDANNSQELLKSAEQVVSAKNAEIALLESRIESISQQFEHRLAEASSWKAQAQSIDVLTATLATMQNQLKEMSEKLEASDRRVIEVEETAKHDVTVMQDEVDERQAELEQARNRISELETALERAKKEVARLEKVCDEFDDDEAQLKEKITELEAEVKQLKGIKTPPRQMGLIQQARQGINPISRESSRVEEQKNEQKEEDAFEDASDSFVAKPQLQRTMIGNATAVESPNVSTAHPDDSSFAATTPSSKKANRSNCQQQ